MNFALENKEKNAEVIDFSRDFVCIFDRKKFDEKLKLPLPEVETKKIEEFVKSLEGGDRFLEAKEFVFKVEEEKKES